MNRGGNFFLSSYGIRIQAAPNTLIAWKPTDWHGTSLYHINPFEKAQAKHHQRGLAFVTGNRLANAMAKGEDIEEEADFVHAAPEKPTEGDSEDIKAQKAAEIDAEVFLGELRKSHPVRAAAEVAKKKIAAYIKEFCRTA